MPLSPTYVIIQLTRILNVIHLHLYFISILIGRSLKTWILGSSIIRNAFVRARQSPEGVNLGLSRIGMELLWQGFGGLGTLDLMPKIRNLSKVEDSPDFIVIHVGGNDLGTVKVGFLRNRIKNIIRKILDMHPNVRIVWSAILPRFEWRYAHNCDAIETARLRINSSIGAFVIKMGGHYIKYTDIEMNKLLFKNDGVHLSETGTDIFLNTLQGSLELFVLYNIPVFPM